jgi:hypothetical protein
LNLSEHYLIVDHHDLEISLYLFFQKVCLFLLQ